MLRKSALTCLVLFGLAAALPGAASAMSLNDWDISCGADKGSIQRKGKTWIFSTSANYCTGGIFNQRAEVYTQNYPTNRKGSYLFSTTFRMTSERNAQFSIFSVHDGRDGCAPPLQLFIDPDNRMRATSAIKTGPGESCIDFDIGQKSAARVKRDGTPQELRILIDFDGKGGFATAVWLDGKIQIQGRYDPPARSDAMLSKRFFFKHGVYSENVFDYQLISEDMRVRKVTVK